jgi:hypothetical protein
MDAVVRLLASQVEQYQQIVVNVPGSDIRTAVC